MADQQTRVVVICPGDQDDRRMIVALRIYHRCESGRPSLEIMLESGAITETGATIQDIRDLLHTSGARVIDVEAARDERSQSAR